MATQRPHDAFPVRVSGAPCEGCSVVGTRRIELTRPRSTIRKAFDLGLICGDEVDTRAAFECSALAPAVRQAFLMAQLEGLGYVEIAPRLGVSERTVKRYMAEAMAHCILLAA